MLKKVKDFVEKGSVYDFAECAMRLLPAAAAVVGATALSMILRNL